MSERDLIEIRSQIDSVCEASDDQYDKWHADRGVTTSRAKWKARALAAEAAIARLSEALAEAEKKGAEETHALAVFLSDLSSFRYGYVSREAIDAIHHFTDSIPDERPLPAPPRDLSQGGRP